MRSQILLINILLLVHYAAAFNILVIVSVPLKSHYQAFHNIFRELALKGHAVTIMNNFPSDENIPNMRFVTLRNDTTPHNFTELEVFENIHSFTYHFKNFMRHLSFSSDVVKVDCENLFTNENATLHLSVRNKYDVIFVEQFMSDCGLAYAATLFDAPIIGITSHTLLPWAYPRLGIPFDIAADAMYFSKSGPNPSLLSKVEAAVGYFIFNTIGKWNIQKSIYDSFRKNLPNVHLDIERVAKERMKMMFSYQHYSVTGARLLAPQLLEIGGAHITKPKPVPEDIEQFLSEAKDGAIFVSFGSNLKASTMSARMLQQFLQAFDKLPQKVLWKWENATFPAGNDNVFFKQWFPQLDVLCHPKVVGFISHGGMLSLSEAAHCGKPMVALPFFGDQFSNAAAIRSVGLGKTLLLADVTSDNLADAIKEMTSAEMQQNAQRVSRLWHDRPMSALQSAIYWTEYVARHGSAPPSLPAKYNTWFESLLLDVASVLFLIALLIVWLACIIVKLIKSILGKFLGKYLCKKKLKSH